MKDKWENDGRKEFTEDQRKNGELCYNWSPSLLTEGMLANICINMQISCTWRLQSLLLKMKSYANFEFFSEALLQSTIISTGKLSFFFQF